MSLLHLSSLLPARRYDAIFEFLQRADIVGNVVNSLPLIGPIRQQVTKELKRALDLVLGPQIKTFLASYSRVAVQRMIDFVLRDENKANFRTANRALAEALLQRSVATLLPSASDSAKLKGKLIDYLWSLSEEDLLRVLGFVYDQFGHRMIGEVVDLQELVSSSSAAEAQAQLLIERYAPLVRGEE